MLVVVTGVDASFKPFPKIVQKHVQLIDYVLSRGNGSVLDIGAGRGRFLKWFLSNIKSLRTYVAVEPHPSFANILRRIAESVNGRVKVSVICDMWQNVRTRLLARKWDIIIAWDVAMFLDLRHVWNTSSFKEALTREIAEWVRHSKLLLLSFWTVKSGLSEISGYENGRKRFKTFHEIVTNALKLANTGKIVDRYHYQNYIILNHSDTISTSSLQVQTMHVYSD